MCTESSKVSVVRSLPRSGVVVRTVNQTNLTRAQKGSWGRQAASELGHGQNRPSTGSTGSSGKAPILRIWWPSYRWIFTV